MYIRLPDTLLVIEFGVRVKLILHSALALCFGKVCDKNVSK